MLNELTKRLYQEGWTREKHPDYVYQSDWENLGYKFDWLKETVWVFPCGLLVQGRGVSASDVSYGGVWYCAENNNPVLRCPHEKRNCPHQDPVLGKWHMCVCRLTDAPYDYEKSAEKVEAERDRSKREAYAEISGGQYCANVVACNGYEPGYYRIDFDVERCIQYRCQNPVCSITKKERNLQKVNVFYDIVRERITRRGILEDRQTSVEKGVRVFSKPVARTDAELWLAAKKAGYNPFLDKDVISPRLNMEDRRMDWFSKHHRKWPDYDYFEFHYRVQNIRIEAKETRDLMQDIQDTENGIEVFHASDAEKAEKAKKQEGRQRAEEEKERKIRNIRLRSFDEHWKDPKWAASFRSYFGADYERMMREKRERESGIGEQISIFEDGTE